MKKLVVAFDVDETLIKQDQSGQDYPNYPVIELLRWFKKQGHTVVIWSGGGEDYARYWGRKLGFADVTFALKDMEMSNALSVDIAVDDAHEFKLGKVQLYV
jgi:predicted HAD superfamily phosphohydrolase YqeG